MWTLKTQLEIERGLKGAPTSANRSPRRRRRPAYRPSASVPLAASGFPTARPGMLFAIGAREMHTLAHVGHPGSSLGVSGRWRMATPAQCAPHGGRGGGCGHRLVGVFVIHGRSASSYQFAQMFATPARAGTVGGLRAHRQALLALARRHKGTARMRTGASTPDVASPGSTWHSSMPRYFIAMLHQACLPAGLHPQWLARLAAAAAPPAAGQAAQGSALNTHRD